MNSLSDRPNNSTDTKPFRWGINIGAVSAQGAHSRSDWSRWERSKRVPESFDGNGFSTNFHDDFKLIKTLGVNSVRLGIDWSACEPYESKIDRTAFDRYSDIVAAAKECGLDIWLTLVDTALPGWFSDDMGGFCDADATSYYFIRQVERCGEYFGDDIAGFTPIDDPIGWALRAYGLGSRPPGHKALSHNAQNSEPTQKSALAAKRRFYEAVEGALWADHLAARLLGQGRALTMCVRHIAPVFTVVKDRHSKRENDAAATQRQWFDSLLFSSWQRMQTDGVLELDLAPGDTTKSAKKRDRIIDSEFTNDFDIIGIGYDHPIGVDANGRLRPYPNGAAVTDTGFAPVPELLGDVVERVDHSLGDKEIVVASTAISTTNDEWRCDILGKHLEVATELATAKKLGGFFAGCAIDGYEFNRGFDTQRGLISRDRKLKASALLYQEHIRP